MNTKQKLSLILILFIFCLIFVYFYNKKPKPAQYKILKVIEADEFYIDINNNNKIDYDEHFKLKNIISLKPVKNKTNETQAKSLNLDIGDYLIIGYFSRKFANDNFLNKNVEILGKIPVFDKNKGYREVELFLNNKSVSRILLENGCATAKDNCFNYIKYQNIKAIKENSKKYKKEDFLVVNLKNNKAHSLNCKYFNEIQNAKLILKQELKNYTPCKICLQNKQKYNVKILKKYNIPKNTKIYKTSLYKKIDDIELFIVNPYVFNKPQTGCNTFICKRLVEEINNSKKSIDIALYGFDSQDEIFNALKKAKQRGVIIRSVVDLSKNSDEIYPDNKKFIEEFNSITDKTQSLMHNKFIIFDNTKVLTGSINFSQTGTGGYNLNSAVIVDSRELSSQYEKEFEQMHNNKFSNKKEKYENEKIIKNNTNIKAIFLPQEKGYDKYIAPIVKNAKKEIFISIFYLTDENFINELINMQKKNIKVLVLVDALCASNFKDRIETLRSTGILVKIENFAGKNHEKTILIDNKILILGSANFSKSGFYKNDENILIIENQELAKTYRDFYLYIFNSIDDKYLIYYPKAEGFDSPGSCLDGIDNDFDGKIDSFDKGCKR